MITVIIMVLITIYRADAVAASLGNEPGYLQQGEEQLIKKIKLQLLMSVAPVGFDWLTHRSLSPFVGFRGSLEKTRTLPENE